jgi:uncharacterized protein (DUF58 family)
MQWLRRAYDSCGLTQYPTGPHLEAVQARFGGSVILCLDVSGSMSGHRLDQAREGCKAFVAEALEAGYSTGGVLWHHAIDATASLSRERHQLDALFDSARASGGNDIVPTLLHCERELQDKSGDLVIAIFGDGDLGDAARARAEALRLGEKNIRVITCGLGQASADQLDVISTETAAPRVAQADDIAGAIAGMASGLKRRN